MRSWKRNLDNSGKDDCSGFSHVFMIHNGSSVNSPNGSVLVALLKALAKRKDLCSATKVHAEILQCDLHTQNIFIGSALLNVYAKSGALAKAQQVFDDLPLPNIVTWNMLIAGYAQHGHILKALDCFEQVKAKGISPDGVTYLCVLKACSGTEAAEKGIEIHKQIAEEGWLRKSTTLGSAVVDMYTKCGALTKAQQVFNELPFQNVVSWTVLIAGYVQHGYDKKALDCYERMQDEGLSPNSFTFACVLKACAETGAVKRGIETHDEIVRKGLLEKDLILATALVDMYAKCGVLGRARLVFDELPLRDRVLWNVLIIGYCEHGHGKQALDAFNQMKDEGLSPDAITYSWALKACGIIRSVEKGRKIHESVAKGPWEKHNAVRTALMNMYAKCGLLVKAQEVFDELPHQDASLWNTLITAYCELGRYDEALERFKQMKCEGLSPDTVTFACILKACGSIGAADMGENCFVQIVKEGLLRNFSVLGSALVGMFANFGTLARAEAVLNKLPVRDVVSWTALITGYCQHGLGEEAVDCFEKMKREGCSPDAVTFACVLKACGNIGAIEKGEEIHAEIARDGLLAKASVLGNALVDMYAKCGALVKAQEVFDKLAYQDKVSWTALIAGFCQHGHGEEALCYFEKMKMEALTPDAVTFACILKACGSIGAAEKGQMYFESMSTTYGIIPAMEHHTCMVDIFSRAGHLDKAMAVIERMAAPHLGCSALISACWKRGNFKLGSLAFEHAARSDANLESV